MEKELSKKDFWLLTLVTYFSMVCQGFIDNARGFTSVIMRDYFGADYIAYGVYNGLCTAGYVVFAMIAAFMQPRYGFKTVFLCGFIGGLIGCLLTASATAYPLVIIYQFLAASGMGFNDVAPTSMASIIFTTHQATFFSIMNFFYGLGAVAGPSFSNVIYNWLPQYSFRGVYIAMSIVVALLSIYVIFCPFAVKYPPVDNKTPDTKNKLTTVGCLKNGMVWFFSIIVMLFEMGERAPSNWAGVYIKDVLKMDETVVANFNTLYYLIFSLMRFAGGFISDRIGYYLTMYIMLALTIVLYIAGFLIDGWGIWLLCATGICTSFYWPTFMCIVMNYFGDLSAIPISVILPLQALLQSIAQFPLGYINDTFGAEWAYRATPLFIFLALILIMVVQCIQRKKDAATKDLETGLLENPEKAAPEQTETVQSA